MSWLALVIMCNVELEQCVMLTPTAGVRANTSVAPGFSTREGCEAMVDFIVDLSTSLPDSYIEDAQCREITIGENM